MKLKYVIYLLLIIIGISIVGISINRSDEALKKSEKIDQKEQDQNTEINLPSSILKESSNYNNNENELPIPNNLIPQSKNNTIFPKTNTQTPSTTTTTPTSKEITISMTDNSFSPSSISINKGDTIVFVNNGSNAHWPASNTHPTHEIYPEFDPRRPISPGSLWEFKFDKSGSWKMHDHLSPGITGTITVK